MQIWFPPFKPDRRLVATMWIIAVIVNVFCLLGYVSGWVVTDPAQNYAKTIQPFEWGAGQIVSVVGAFVMVPLSLLLSWKLEFEAHTRFGAALFAVLPLIPVFLLLFGVIETSM